VLTTSSFRALPPAQPRCLSAGRRIRAAARGQAQGQGQGQGPGEGWGGWEGKSLCRPLRASPRPQFGDRTVRRSASLCCLPRALTMPLNREWSLWFALCAPCCASPPVAAPLPPGAKGRNKKVGPPPDPLGSPQPPCLAHMSPRCALCAPCCVQPPLPGPHEPLVCSLLRAAPPAWPHEPFVCSLLRAAPPAWPT